MSGSSAAAGQGAAAGKLEGKGMVDECGDVCGGNYNVIYMG